MPANSILARIQIAPNRRINLALALAPASAFPFLPRLVRQHRDRARPRDLAVLPSTSSPRPTTERQRRGGESVAPVGGMVEAGEGRVLARKPETMPTVALPVPALSCWQGECFRCCCCRKRECPGWAESDEASSRCWPERPPAKRNHVESDDHPSWGVDERRLGEAKAGLAPLAGTKEQNGSQWPIMSATGDRCGAL
jgi:hypothetical protein